MSDLISRQAVIDIIHKEIERTTSFSEHETQINIEMAVKELPTAYNVDSVVAEKKKTIDEFKNKICMHFADWKYSEDDKRIKDIIELASESVEEIADQMKEGGIDG